MTQQDDITQRVLTDAEIQALWDEACKDSPQAPGWNRHIRFARALLSKVPAPIADSTLRLEQALHELIDKIVPGLDTGDLVQDARRASTALSATLASAPVAGERAAVDPCGYVAVKVSAVDWLKDKFPALTIKAGLCERIGGRLYTITRLMRDHDAALASAPVNDLAAAIHWPACWDAAAYPTVDSALAAVAASFQCSNQDTHQAPDIDLDSLTDPSALSALADGLESIVGNENAALAAAYIRQQAEREASAPVACNCPGGSKPVDLHAPNCPVRTAKATLVDPYDGGTWLASAPVTGEQIIAWDVQDTGLGRRYTTYNPKVAEDLMNLGENVRPLVYASALPPANAAPQASAENVRELPDAEMRTLIGNYFADDWAKEAAAGLLHDYARALKTQADKGGAVDKSPNLQGSSVDRSTDLKGRGDDVVLPPLPSPPVHRGHALFAGSQMQTYARAAVLADRQQRAENARSALTWYAEQVAGCRKLGPDGDAARNALDTDGGQRARAALSAPPQAEQGERDA